MTSQNGDFLCSGVMLTAVVFHRFSDYLNRGTPPPFSAEAEHGVLSATKPPRLPKVCPPWRALNRLAFFVRAREPPQNQSPHQAKPATCRSVEPSPTEV